MRPEGQHFGKSKESPQPQSVTWEAPIENPIYLDVCARITGHAEVVQVEYDPSQMSYDELLTVFWDIHDPTTLNRQGPDRGEQYRSVIFFHNAEQEDAAKRSLELLQLSGRFNKDIVTEIKPASTYWLASDYHQQYFEKKGRRARSRLEILT